MILAQVSGGYLLTMGPMPDPLPIVDEALMLMVFVQALAARGVDVRKWLPFFGKKMPPPMPGKGRGQSGVPASEQTIDV
jgi:hypothetical protein